MEKRWFFFLEKWWVFGEMVGFFSKGHGGPAREVCNEKIRASKFQVTIGVGPEIFTSPKKKKKSFGLCEEKEPRRGARVCPELLLSLPTQYCLSR